MKCLSGLRLLLLACCPNPPRYGGRTRTHGISDPRGGQSNGSCFDHELKPAIHRAPNLQFRFSELLKDLSGAGFVADDLLRSALST